MEQINQSPVQQRNQTDETTSEISITPVKHSCKDSLRPKPKNQFTVIHSGNIAPISLKNRITQNKIYPEKLSDHLATICIKVTSNFHILAS
jgi:hypothetical protein